RARLLPRSADRAALDARTMRAASSGIAEDEPTVVVARRRPLRSVFRVLLLLLLTAVLLEATTRIYFANQMGERLYYYGTPWHRNEHPPTKWATDPWADSVQNHQNVVGDYQPYQSGTTGYSKYFPGEKKWTQGLD